MQKNLYNRTATHEFLLEDLRTSPLSVRWGGASPQKPVFATLDCLIFAPSLPVLTDAARPTGSRVPLTWVTRSASRRRKGRESSHSYLPRMNKSTHWQRSIGNWFSGVSICSSSMYFRTLTLLVSRRSFLRTLILSKCYLSSGATRIKEVMENILHPFPIY